MSIVYLVYFIFLYLRYPTDLQNNSVDGIRSNNETNTNEAESDIATAHNSFMTSDNSIEKSSHNIEIDEVCIGIQLLEN